VDLVFEPARGLAGEVRVPGDKSITHRAYLLSAAASGTTTITGANEGADCAATLAALEALGVEVARGGGGARVVRGRPEGFDPPARALDLGNSGTGLRLLAGLLAGRGTAATLTGDASLRTRPMRRILEPLRAMGAELEARGADARPPLVLPARATPLRGIEHALPIASAQVKSAILLAGLAALGPTRVTEPLASRDHTERMLPVFGVRIDRSIPLACTLEGPAALRSPGRVAIPGDFSAAFFWLVAGSVVQTGEVTIRDVGLNPGRTGGLAVLRRMGADIATRNERVEGGEPVGDLVVRPAALVATDVQASEIPSLVDELPALAVAQACAQGVSRVAGAGELRVKESDRIWTVVNALRALGGVAHEVEDGWAVTGGPLRGGTIETRGDHRIGMAFGMAALAAGGPVTVREGEMIDTSYPRFYSDLRARVTSR
jgi:3-phosphoshikimate 1-carboxyvinyltransferase